MARATKRIAPKMLGYAALIQPTSVKGTGCSRKKEDDMRQIELPLVAGEAQLILEALADLDAKWDRICDTSQDNDEVADYGNDLIELRLLIDKVKEAAIPVFGAGVTNFSRDLL